MKQNIWLKMVESGSCRLCFEKSLELVKINEEIRENFHSLTNIHVSCKTFDSNFYRFILKAPGFKNNFNSHLYWFLLLMDFSRQKH